MLAPEVNHCFYLVFLIPFKCFMKETDIISMKSEYGYEKQRSENKNKLIKKKQN